MGFRVWCFSVEFWCWRFLVCRLVIQGLIVLSFKLLMVFWLCHGLIWWLFMMTCARARGFGWGKRCGRVGYTQLWVWYLWVEFGYCDLVCWGLILVILVLVFGVWLGC